MAQRQRLEVLQPVYSNNQMTNTWPVWQEKRLLTHLKQLRAKLISLQNEINNDTTYAIEFELLKTGKGVPALLKEATFESFKNLNRDYQECLKKVKAFEWFDNDFEANQDYSGLYYHLFVDTFQKIEDDKWQEIADNNQEIKLIKQHYNNRWCYTKDRIQPCDIYFLWGLCLIGIGIPLLLTTALIHAVDRLQLAVNTYLLEVASDNNYERKHDDFEAKIRSSVKNNIKQTFFECGRVLHNDLEAIEKHCSVEPVNGV